MVPLLGISSLEHREEPTYFFLLSEANYISEKLIDDPHRIPIHLDCVLIASREDSRTIPVPKRSEGKREGRGSHKIFQLTRLRCTKVISMSRTFIRC